MYWPHQKAKIVYNLFVFVQVFFWYFFFLGGVAFLKFFLWPFSLFSSNLYLGWILQDKVSQYVVNQTQARTVMYVVNLAQVQSLMLLIWHRYSHGCCWTNTSRVVYVAYHAHIQWRITLHRNKIINTWNLSFI